MDGETQTTIEKDGLVTVTLVGISHSWLQSSAVGFIGGVIVLD